MKEKYSIIPNGQGTVYRAFGNEITVKLEARQTGGTFTLLETTTPPGGNPPPHFHTDEDQLFIVQEGRVSFFMEDEWKETGTGSVVYAPRGTVHTFRNLGETPCRMLIMTHPSGFETFFARCAEEFNRPEGPDMDRIVAIGAKHGIHRANPVVRIETVEE